MHSHKPNIQMGITVDPALLVCLAKKKMERETGTMQSKNNKVRFCVADMLLYWRTATAIGNDRKEDKKKSCC